MSSDRDPLTALGRLEDGGFRRLAARLALLRAYVRYREREGCSDAQAQDDIAAAYERHAASVPDWTYDVYDSVTARTLRRWANEFQEDGLPGLIDRHGRRSRRSYESYFGPGSELRKIALYYIADHPECTSTELRDELAQHVDEDELPTLRTVQRFLSKMS
ncbi:MAG: helix-turn-helix domain-containing protein [Salinibacter sp.]